MAWKGSKGKCIVLPNGKILHDAFIWENFMQNELRMNPKIFWRNLLNLPTWPNDEPITHDPKGSYPHWIEGIHPALNYRGHAIKRHKIWCQDNYKNGLLRYRYTGWQYKISNATADYKFVPGMKKFVKKMNDGLNIKHNHWIITKYKNEKDNIGFHSDKNFDIKVNSYFVIIKLGEPRLFEFRLKGISKPFYSEILNPGTAVFVRAKSKNGTDANTILQHAVPPMKTPVGLSGSIVGRTIETVIDWETIQRKM